MLMGRAWHRDLSDGSGQASPATTTHPTRLPSAIRPLTAGRVFRDPFDYVIGVDFQSVSRLLVHQQRKLVVNQYEVFAPGDDGKPGALLAFAKQKRLSLKEKVTLFTDSMQTTPVAHFVARKVLDVSTTYDVTDADGAPIGSFRKDFRRSLVRSTWHLDQPGIGESTGVERNQIIAVVRRLWTLIPMLGDVPFLWPYHFDFAQGDKPAFSVSKKFGLTDRYVVDIHDDRLDRRLVMMQAVALDALQSR